MLEFPEYLLCARVAQGAHKSYISLYCVLMTMLKARKIISILQMEKLKIRSLLLPPARAIICHQSPRYVSQKTKNHHQFDNTGGRS
jgi:hypothetical protein